MLIGVKGVVLVSILSIASVFGLTRVLDLRNENTQEFVQSVASKIETRSARNHAVDIAVEGGLTTIATDPFVNIANCSDGQHLLDTNVFPDGYHINPGQVLDQIAVSCILGSKGGKTASFIIIGAAGGVDPS